MRNRMFALSVFVMLLAVSAMAASSDRLMVEVPFDFHIGEKSMPAGHYYVKSSPTSSGSFQIISNENGRNNMLVMTLHARHWTSVGENSRVVFNRYGNTYYLSQIWYGGSASSHELGVSRSEREMAMVHPAETMQLALVAAPKY